MNHEAFSIAGGDVPRRLACPRACSASGISLGATRQLVAATSWGVGTQKKEVRGVPPAPPIWPPKDGDAARWRLIQLTLKSTDTAQY